jgi:hypothetical protein
MAAQGYIRPSTLIPATDRRLSPVVRRPTMKFRDGKFATCLSGPACLMLSAHSAPAIEGGVFCIKAGPYFVERPEPNGALTFDVLESNA